MAGRRRYARTIEPEILTPAQFLALPPQADGTHLCVAADPANGVVWRFRFNAGSSNAAKWEFVGGSWMEAFLATQLQPGTTVTLAGGPSLTLPLGGDYDMEHGTFIQLPGTASVTGGIQYLYINGASAAQFIQWYDTGNTVTAPILNQLRRGRRMAGRAAGEVWDLRHQSLNANGNALFGDRYLRICPVRVIGP